VKVDLDKAKQVIEPIMTGLGYELVDLRLLHEQRGWVLRIYADREGGMTVGDCERVSREVDTPLEVEGVIPIHYNLEVSTPGLDRPLVKEADFLRFSGRPVQVQSQDPIEGRRNFKGMLEGVGGGCVRVTVDGIPFAIPLTQIKKAHLVY
jgi:ribosome maturation factor RimP